MTSTYVFVVLIVSVGALVFMVSKLKFHAVLALYLASLMLALLVGTPIEKIPKMINTGFGNTCKSVALVIFLGSLLGIILNKTGAIVKLTDSLVKFFGKKKVLWAIGTSCCILGIPVFPDTVSLLVIPLCTNLAKKTGISMMAFASVIQISITTSSLVPPTPGPVAAAAALGLPLGVAIPWGILVAIPGLLATVLYANTLKDKQVPLNEAFLEDTANSTTADLSMGFVRAITPVLLPVVLIILQTVSGVMMPKSSIAKVMTFIGDPLSALFIGCFSAVFLQARNWVHNLDIRDKWINSAVLDCAGPVFITALGGSLAAFIKSAGAAKILAESIVAAHIPGIFVPMLIGFMIRTATGSNTLGVATAAALCEPMLDILGISKLAAFLAMCSGAIAFSHANSSGFWLTCSLSKLNFNQGFRAIGGSTALSGLATSIFTLILYFAGII